VEFGPLLVRAGAAAVVSLRGELSDRGALEFSFAFHQALARGEPLGVAINTARRNLLVSVGADSSDWITPVLHTRPPNGRLLAEAADRPAVTPR
jgi:hypothetical protein